MSRSDLKKAPPQTPLRRCGEAMMPAESRGGISDSSVGKDQCLSALGGNCILLVWTQIDPVPVHVNDGLTGWQVAKRILLAYCLSAEQKLNYQWTDSLGALVFSSMIGKHAILKQMYVTYICRLIKLACLISSIPCVHVSWNISIL